MKPTKNDGYQTIMFVQGNDEHAILWSGPKSSPQDVKRHFLIHDAFEWKYLESYLEEEVFSIKNGNCTNGESLSIYYDFDQNNCIDLPRKFFPFIKDREGEMKMKIKNQDETGNEIGNGNQEKKRKWEIKPLAPIMHNLRIIKSPKEQEIIKNAGLKASEAFKNVMVWSMKNNIKSEAQISARMEYECKIRGASGMAYTPVVAGGSRSNILHYVRNDMMIEQDEMVLMDAGGLFHNYCTDISRSWPISGKWTMAQRGLYSALLKVQEECIKICSKWKKLSLTIQSLNEISMYLLAEELAKLGFKNIQKVNCISSFDDYFSFSLFIDLYILSICHVIDYLIFILEYYKYLSS